MTYYRSVLGDWSRRDWLAVLGVALTTAFLVGAVLLLVTAGAQLTERADRTATDLQVDVYDSVSTAQRNAPSDATVFPISTTTVDNRSIRLLAIPSDAETAALRRNVSVPNRPPPGVLRIEGANSTPTVSGDGGNSLAVRPRLSKSFVPPDWGIIHSSLTDQFQPAGALVIGDQPALRSESTVPLVSISPFFRIGTEQLVTLMLLMTAASSVFVVVLVFTVTRMSIRDRRRTIHVLRATGASPQRVLTLIVGRASGLMLTGITLGFALGIIATNAATNVAIFLGWPTTLDPELTLGLAWRLVGLLGILGLAGVFAGVLAGWTISRQPPARILDRASGEQDARITVPVELPNRFRAVFSTRLLSWRTTVPTTATLTVFIAFLLVLLSIGGTFGPLVESSESTVIQQSAPHPMASQVDADYASILRSQGIAASPEILLFEVIDGRGVLARGVNFSAFRTVSGATLERGSWPSDPDEAAIGDDIAAIHEIRPGTRVWLGGSNRPGITQVTVVGIYDTGGILGKQLLVSLPSARALANVGSDSAHLIRLGPQTEPTGSRPLGRQTTSPPPDDTTPPDEQSPSGEPELSIRHLPTRLPPNATLQVTVENPAGNPVSNATVVAGGRHSVTNDAGRATISFPDPGTREVSVIHPGWGNATRSVRVVAGASRLPLATSAVEPSAPDALVRPTVRVNLTNPWTERVNSTIRVTGPRGDRVRSVSIPPGAHTEFTVELSRAPPGTYTVDVSAAGTRLTASSYTVRGDDRLVSSMFESDRIERGSGLGQSIERVLGNLQFILGTLFVLVAGTTIGSTTATFASAVHSRRRTIGVHRATGATPRQVSKLVLADVLRLGAISSGIALVLAVISVVVLSHTGLLAIFGIVLAPELSVLVVGSAIVAGVGMALVGGALALGTLLNSPPQQLLVDSRGDSRGTTTNKQPGERPDGDSGDEADRSAGSDTAPTGGDER